MKYILIDVYNLISFVIKKRRIARILAVLYVSYLGYILLNGICVLLDVYVDPEITGFFFSFPHGLYLFILIFLIHLAIMPSRYILRKERKRDANFIPIAVYTLAAIISFLYVRYGDQITF